jgi:hypothetical protein
LKNAEARNEEEASKEKLHQKRQVAPNQFEKSKGRAILAAPFLFLCINS